MKIKLTCKPKFINATGSRHSSPNFESVLNRNFRLVAENQIWVSDIAYI